MSKFIVKMRNTKTYEPVYENISDYKDLVKRLVSKRPYMFMGVKNKNTKVIDDYFIDRNGKPSFTINANGKWTLKKDFTALSVEDYITYDEIPLAAMISMSSHTPFINNGNRNNEGEVGKTYEKEGVYIGCVGSRLEKAGVMEHKFLLEHPAQKDTQVDAMYREFFKGGEVVLDLKGGFRLNKDRYTKRMRMTIEPFLDDAQARGVSSQKNVFVRIVGLGLGVWTPGYGSLSQRDFEHNSKQLANLMMGIYHDYVKECPLIKNIEFVWSPYEKKTYTIHNTTFTLLSGEGNPADPVPEGCLLVAQFAWDGGSYVGNEYWGKHLDASGDPAAMCCSAMPELAVPEYNPGMFDHVRIYG